MASWSNRWSPKLNRVLALRHQLMISLIELKAFGTTLLSRRKKCGIPKASKKKPFWPHGRCCVSQKYISTGVWSPSFLFIALEETMLRTMARATFCRNGIKGLHSIAECSGTNSALHQKGRVWLLWTLADRCCHGLSPNQVQEQRTLSISCLGGAVKKVVIPFEYKY